MSEPPSPPYNLPIGDTDTGTEAAEAVIEVAEAALGFTSVAAAAAGVAAAAAVEAAGGGAIDPARVATVGGCFTHNKRRVRACAWPET